MAHKIRIAITTYNRLHYLSNLISSLEHLERDVEIFVFDNGSTDNTLSYMASLCTSNKRVFYHRNSIGHSFDHNFESVVTTFSEMPNDYTILIADDDRIDTNVIRNIRTIIDQHEPDFIQFNFATYNYINEVFKVITRWGPENDKIVFYSSPVEYFKDSFHSIPWYCGLVVKNNILDINNTKKFRGTYHSYIGGPLEWLANKYCETASCSIIKVSLKDEMFFLNHVDSIRTWTSEEGKVFSSIINFFEHIHPLYRTAFKEMFIENYYNKGYYSVPKRRIYLDEASRNRKLYFFDQSDTSI